MDSIRQFDGQPLPTSIWEQLHGTGEQEKPDTLHLLSGNFDEDPDHELLIWYRLTQGGRARCFNKGDSAWYPVVEPIPLDYWHGNTPPGLEPKLNALIIPFYGWGSSFGSESQLFLRMIEGEMVPILKLVKEEYNGYISGCTAYRKVLVHYTVVHDTTVSVRYDYTLFSGEEGPFYGKTVFKGKLQVPYCWHPASRRFVPVMPENTDMSGVDWPIQEEFFDQYFRPELERIRKNGPTWKKQSLWGWDVDR